MPQPYTQMSTEPSISLPFHENLVDKIIASGPRAAFLDEVARVLKKGGKVFINATARNGLGQEMEDPRPNKISTGWVYMLSNNLGNCLRGFLISSFA